MHLDIPSRSRKREKEMKEYWTDINIIWNQGVNEVKHQLETSRDEIKFIQFVLSMSLICTSLNLLQNKSLRSNGFVKISNWVRELHVSPIHHSQSLYLKLRKFNKTLYIQACPIWNISKALFWSVFKIFNFFQNLYRFFILKLRFHGGELKLMIWYG